MLSQAGMVRDSLEHELHVDVYRRRAMEVVVPALTIRPVPVSDAEWLEHVRDEIGETTRVPNGEAW